jgi:hypothetical protein
MKLKAKPAKKTQMKLAIMAVVAVFGAGLTLGAAAEKTPEPPKQQTQISCPTEDSCKAKAQYYDGAWHLAVKPDKS